MHGEGACGNCGNTSYIVDYERGQYTCDGCGCVDPAPLMVACTSFKERYDCQGTLIHDAPLSETFRYGAFTETAADTMAIAANQKMLAKNSAQYKRDTYANELISQWQLREPDISHEDWNAINELWRELTGQHSYYNKEGTPQYRPAIWEPTRIISKEDCRYMLWELDVRGASTGVVVPANKMAYFSPSTTFRPHFVKKYLVSVLYFVFCFLVLAIRARCKAA